MELFSAILLICSVATGEPECSMEVLDMMHKQHLDCIKQLSQYEKEAGRKLAKQEQYIMSSACVDWRFQAHPLDKRTS